MPVTRTRTYVTPNQPFDHSARSIVNEVRKGMINNGGEVTLTPGSATTTLKDALISPNSRVTLDTPLSVNAAAALATTYFETPTAGSIVIKHANSPQVDRTFRYSVWG